MLKFSEWMATQKPWVADKKKTMQIWSTIPVSPIVSAKPIPRDHHGSTYGFDGIRITGSQKFINTTLSRIKDILAYEGGRTNLDVAYRQQVDKTSGWPLQNSYVFYAKIQNRTNIPV